MIKSLVLLFIAATLVAAQDNSTTNATGNATTTMALTSTTVVTATTTAATTTASATTTAGNATTVAATTTAAANATTAATTTTGATTTAATTTPYNGTSAAQAPTCSGVTPTAVRADVSTLFTIAGNNLFNISCESAVLGWVVPPTTTTAATTTAATTTTAASTSSAATTTAATTTAGTTTAATTTAATTSQATTTRATTTAATTLATTTLATTTAATTTPGTTTVMPSQTVRGLELATVITARQFIFRPPIPGTWTVHLSCRAFPAASNTACGTFFASLPSPPVTLGFAGNPPADRVKYLNDIATAVAAAARISRELVVDMAITLTRRRAGHTVSFSVIAPSAATPASAVVASVATAATSSALANAFAAIGVPPPDRIITAPGAAVATIPPATTAAPAGTPAPTNTGDAQPITVCFYAVLLLASLISLFML